SSRSKPNPGPLSAKTTVRHFRDGLRSFANHRPNRFLRRPPQAEPSCRRLPGRPLSKYPRAAWNRPWHLFAVWRSRRATVDDRRHLQPTGRNRGESANAWLAPYGSVIRVRSTGATVLEIGCCLAWIYSLLAAERPGSAAAAASVSFELPETYKAAVGCSRWII